MNNQPSLEEWVKKAIDYIVEVYYSPSNEYTRVDFEKDIHQVILEAKAQGALEERERVNNELEQAVLVRKARADFDNVPFVDQTYSVVKTILTPQKEEKV